MITVSREKVLGGLDLAAKALCCQYQDLQGARKHGVCDCKYGGQNATSGSVKAMSETLVELYGQAKPGEQTGCPEVRLAGYILQKMTPEEFKAIFDR